MGIADIATDVLPYQCQNFTKHLSRFHAVGLIVARRRTWIISLIYRKISAYSFVLQYTKTYTLGEEASNPLLKGPPGISG
jgi:hypothetical protein